MARFRVWLPVVVLLLLGVGPVSAKEVVGWVERVKVYSEKGATTIKAKVDTGAKSSSLHCKCITPIKRNGKDWVSFSVENDKGEVVMIEKPVQRIARIKRHFGEEQQRFVIKLGVCMGSVYRETDVTLVDRTGFNYAMLVGRRFMEEDFLVDGGGKFLNPPSCKDAPKK